MKSVAASPWRNGISGVSASAAGGGNINGGVVNKQR